MLTLHFSNRQEDLAALLIDALQLPGASPFSADEVIVPSAAVRRAVSLRLARQQGVCANLRFSYLAQWLWQQAGLVLAAGSGRKPTPVVAGADAPWQPALLAWRIFGVLGDAGWVAQHPRLARYLGQADAVSRFELAQRCASLIDQYISYRPDWLARWHDGQSALPPGSTVDEDWQAALWRRLRAELQATDSGVDPTATHELAAQLAQLEQLVDDDEHRRNLRALGLPATAHLFCLPTIAPAYLALLHQLGRWIDLHIYAINPCEAYWFEVVDRRRLARLAAAGRAEHHETGHRLLAAWGQQTQAQLSGLVDACGDGVLDEGLYRPHPADHLLARLHNSILQLEDLTPGSVPLRASDRSIELHVCHSLTRELEVLQDRLLAMMAQADPAQRPAPDEILVVTPDLEAAAPLIHAVFGTASPERALPYSLTGQSVSTANAPARALLALLALAGSRCSASAVFELLQQAPVARRFGLDRDSLDQIHHWLLQAGLHWGLDADHRAALGLPAVDRHSLADALERLMLGYALPADCAEPFQHKLPAGAAEGLSALALGALWQFASGLRQLQADVALPLTPARWAALLPQLIDRFTLADASELADAAALRAALGQLHEQWQGAGLLEALPLDLLRQALSAALDEPARGGVPGGRICFSAMASLRSLPYRVVCMIGLNDGAFPSAAPAAEFDLMALQPRAGDRQRRQDERNLFLDLLLAAQDTVHLSHSGRSVRDNSALPPSVLVAELLDYLQPALAATPAQARDQLVVDQPLQAFDASLFDPASDPRVRSHHQGYARALALGLLPTAPAPATSAATTAPLNATAAAAQARGGERRTAQADAGGIARADDSANDDSINGPIHGQIDKAVDNAFDDEDDDNTAHQAMAPIFFGQPLPPLGAAWREPELAQLQRFFRHPSRALLQQRLGLQLRHAEDTLDDDEAFLPDGRSRAALARRLLPALAAGADAQRLQALADAGIELPSGTLGRLSLQAELPLLRGHAERLARLTQQALLSPHVATLALQVAGEPWLLRVALPGLRADGLLLHRYDTARAADHIAAWIAHLSLCACAPAGVAGRTRWLGREAGFSFRPCDDAPDQLQALLALYAQGLSEPLYFFPKTAWAWATGQRSLSQARKAWLPSQRVPWAEQADGAHRLVLRGLPDPLAGAASLFQQVSEAVLAPLLAHLEALDEGPA